MHRAYDGHRVTDAAPPEIDDGPVTRSAFNWLVREFEALRTGLMGSPIYGGGIIPELRRQIADAADAAQERREAALWRGWRGWVLSSVGAIVVALVIAGLTSWVLGNVNAVHMVTAP